MKNTLIRDGLGRILGSVNDYWNDENESYFDYKETHITFPRHNQGKSSPVTVWNLNDKKN